jgi:voltage-gated potassium channel
VAGEGLTEVVSLEPEWVGARASVGLTFLVAVLSVATGIVNIGAGVRATGPLARYVPEIVATTAGFTGTLTGFLLLVSAFGLQGGRRLAWYSAVVLFPVTAAQGLLQASEFSVPLVALSLVAWPVVVVNRRRFDRSFDLGTTQLAALAALVGTQVYGTVGSFALRERFAGIDSLTDAFYFTLVTGSTVGYGDVTPQDEVARIFGISVLLVSVSSFAVALGVLLTPAIEARLSKALGRMTESELELLENHVLVLGYGELTEPVLGALREANREFVVVTPDREQARTLSDRDFPVLTADPSDEEALGRANVEDAVAVVAATNDDAEDALAILTARQLNPGVRIVAAATHRENINKLKRAGANTVISPASIGGRLLVQSALGGEGTEAIAEILEREGQGAQVAAREGEAADADPPGDA